MGITSVHPPTTSNQVPSIHNFTLQSIALIPQCLLHSSKSTPPRATRSLETTPLQPCQRHLSRRPTVAPQRRQDEESMARRQSFHDAYGKPGFLGTLWNNFTRGPVSPPGQK